MHDNMLVTSETKTIGWYFSQLNNFNKTGVYFSDEISCEINGCLILEVLHGLIVLYKYGITDYEYTCICKLSRRVQWFSQWCFIQNVHIMVQNVHIMVQSVHIMVQSTLWDTCTRYKKNQFYLQWSFHNQLISSTYSLLSCL